MYFEWRTKNIKGIFFFYISSETVHENSLKYYLDNHYSLTNTVDGTRSHHSFIPTSPILALNEAGFIR